MAQGKLKARLLNGIFMNQQSFIYLVLSDIRDGVQLRNMTRKIYLLLIILVTGCASYRLDEAQTNLRSSFATHNFGKTANLLEKYERKDIYKSKDNVLYNLEMGTVAHFNGQYDSSTEHFSEAEQEIDDLFTRSISRGIASFIFKNDNTLAYNGEAYEDIYLNAFKSLNFIKQNDLEGALVEARRMSYKLSRVEQKYKGLAQALSKADTLGKGDWKTGQQSVQNSPLGHYLSSILYAKSGKPDDARIEYEKTLEAIQNMPGGSISKADRQRLQAIKNGSQYNVLLVGFAGRAPIKYQHDTRLYLDDADLYLKFSLPYLRLYHSQVAQVNAVINQDQIIPLQLIEQMDVVAREVYKVKEPIIYARTLVRSLAKAIGSNAAGRAIKKENKGLGFLVNILGKVGQEFTEKADTRSWQTMPGQAYATTAQLPPGSHHVEIEYRDAQGNLLYSRQAQLEIAPNENLALLESLYWN